MGYTGRPKTAKSVTLAAPSLRQLEESRAKNERREQDKIRSVVLNQPHRAGAEDPEDRRLEEAFGRFCIRLGLPSEIYKAGQIYEDILRRWQAAMGIPRLIRVNEGNSNSDGPSAETVENWAKVIKNCESEMRRVWHMGIGYYAARMMLVEKRDLAPGSISEAAARLALVALARELDQLPPEPRQ